MKKLIDELEKELAHHAQYQASAYDCGRLSGFDDALDIVRTHNPWHEVTELPPYYEGQFKDSIEVNVMDSKAKIISVASYSYERKCWDTDYRPMNVTHWAFLPEVKP